MRRIPTKRTRSEVHPISKSREGRQHALEPPGLHSEVGAFSAGFREIFDQVVFQTQWLDRLVEIERFLDAGSHVPFDISLFADSLICEPRKNVIGPKDEGNRQHECQGVDPPSRQSACGPLPKVEQ